MVLVKCKQTCYVQYEISVFCNKSDYDISLTLPKFCDYTNMTIKKFNSAVISSGEFCTAKFNNVECCL